MVSVIMITYNHEKYLSEAIQGVLMQQCEFAVELIIADDCSTDNTKEVIESFKSHPNYQWIKYTKHSINKGMMPNFIWAMNQARGKYIALCEGDDYWTDPYKLQKQVEFLEQNKGYAGTYTDTLVLKNGLFSMWREHLPNELNLTEVISLWAPFHTSSFLFNKKAINLEDYNKIKDVKSGDMLLFTLVALKGKLKKIDCKPTIYRKHEGGITNNLEHNESFLHINRINLWLQIKHNLKVNNDAIDIVIKKHLVYLIKHEKINLNLQISSKVSYFERMIMFLKSKLKKAIRYE